MGIKIKLSTALPLFLLVFMMACSSSNGEENDVSSGKDTSGPEDLQPELSFGKQDTSLDTLLDIDQDIPGEETINPVDVVSKACEENPGAVGCPCTLNKDCDSALCTFHLGDRVCTMDCIEECPEDYSCVATSSFGPDETYACMSNFPSLCIPCAQSSDCKTLGERCVYYPGGVGSFCGSPCMGGTGCPEGYECSELETPENDMATVCIREDLQCPCSNYSIGASLGTSCNKHSRWGTCSAWRECGPEGLTSCDAPDAGPELCFNDVDEDCDGGVDDLDVCGECECGDDACQEIHCQESWTQDALNCATDCAICGDSECDPGEGPGACPGDCCGTCGDGVCRAVCGETQDGCPADCAGACGDGVCDQGENPIDCELDCPRGSCGNRVCEPGEDSSTCGDDCSNTCGDCVCQPEETYWTCPEDCGFCGDGYCFDTCPFMYPAEDLASCFDDCCVPDCQGRDCGTNGCGGFCGDCPVNHVCQEGGLCLCVPACEDNECGDDGCGGSCGVCGLGTICMFGDCLAGCTGPENCTSTEECVAGYCQPNMVDAAELIEPTMIETIPGQTSEKVMVKAFEAGLTEAAGQAAELTVELGYGSQTFDPQANPQEWTWTSATYAQDLADGEAWEGSLTSPLPGEYGFTFRLSLDGSHWVYADKSGNSDGYDVEALGLWVIPAGPTITQVTPSTGTVLGGDLITIHGAGFKDGLTVVLGGEVLTPSQVSPSTAMFTTPSHVRGPLNVSVTNPNSQSTTIENGFTFILRFTPTVDGDTAEWSDLFKLAQTSIESNWDPELNSLASLHLAFDSDMLYVAVNGYCQGDNYIIGYIDHDFGASSGIAEIIDLSDNQGDGDLDDALSNIMSVQVEGFGADVGFGTKGMSSIQLGDDISGAAYVGWRSLSPPYNFPWLPGSVVCTGDALEAAIPLTTLAPEGLGQARDAAVFIRLTNRYGTEGGLSNQSLPESLQTVNMTIVDSISTFLLAP
jgi:IPT/TIG domain